MGPGRLIAGAFVAALWGGALLWAQPGPEGQMPADPRHGRGLYELHCLRCHGEGLDGKGPDAASLSIPPTNFRSHPSRVKDDFDLWFTIKQGRSFSAMHGWSETLHDQDIKDIVAYIRSIAPRDRR